MKSIKEKIEDLCMANIRPEQRITMISDIMQQVAEHNFERGLRNNIAPLQHMTRIISESAQFSDQQKKHLTDLYAKCIDDYTLKIKENEKA